MEGQEFCCDFWTRLRILRKGRVMLCVGAWRPERQRQEAGEAGQEDQTPYARVQSQEVSHEARHSHTEPTGTEGQAKRQA